MRKFCAKIARDHAIDALRRAAKRERDFVGHCDPDASTQLEYGAARRDPVDARRQIEVLAQLFREDKMPERGVDILLEFASGTTYADIGEDLGISPDRVEWCMRTMPKVFRRRMVKLWMWPGMDLLRLVSPPPGAATSNRSRRAGRHGERWTERPRCRIVA